MPNVVITTEPVNDPTKILVAFNDEADRFGYQKGQWRVDSLIEVLENHQVVECRMSNGDRYFCQVPAGTNQSALKIDSVDGVAVTDLDSLYTLLSGLIP